MNAGEHGASEPRWRETVCNAKRWAFVSIWLIFIAGAACGADSYQPSAPLPNKTGVVRPGASADISAFSWESTSSTYVVRRAITSEEQKAARKRFIERLAASGDMADGWGKLVGPMPDGKHLGETAERASTLLTWQTRTLEFADNLHDKGAANGIYNLGKDITITKVGEIVQASTSELVYLAILGSGSPLLVPIAGEISWAAGYLADQAIEGFLEGLFAVLERLLAELFASVDDGLNDILAAGKADLSSALKQKMGTLESEREQLSNSADTANQVGRSLSQIPSATLGTAVMSGLQLAQQTWSVLDQTQPVKGGPTHPDPGDITVYDIQISAAEAQNATGKAWAVRYAMPADLARASITLADQTVGTDYATGVTPNHFIGVIREYKVSASWFKSNGGVRYEGFDRPRYQIRRKQP